MDRVQELERDVARMNQELLAWASPRVAELTTCLRNLTALVRTGGPHAALAQDALRAYFDALEEARAASSGILTANGSRPNV